MYLESGPERQKELLYNGGMTKERYDILMYSDDFAPNDTNLTAEEMACGWHFCWGWDGLLIHPSWEEADCCNCD